MARDTTVDGDNAAQVAERRILQTVAATAGNRGELAATFAQATLRRVAPRTLERADEDVAAAWLADAFQWMDDAPTDTLSVRLWTPARGVDGRGPSGTVVEVVGEDRPFLLSTVTRTVEAWGASVVRRLHPILGTQRDAEGHLSDLGAARHAERLETFLHLELDRRLDADEVDELRDLLSTALQDVLRATDDHGAMRQRLEEASARLRRAAPDRDDADSPEEVADLLTWLLDDNLVMLGWRSYEITWDGDEGVVTAHRGSGLGILRVDEQSRFATPTPISQLSPAAREQLDDSPLLRVTRTSRRSTVHRLRPMLDVVLTWRDDHGRPVHIERLLGLFTAAGLGVPASRTPVLRDRLRRVLEVEDAVPGSHEEVTLVGLFQSLPKDELLELDAAALRKMLITLLDAEEHGRVRAVVRIDAPTRTVTVVLAVPRDDYGAVVRQRVTDLLVERLGGPVDVDVSMGEHAEVVARFTVRSEHAGEVDPGHLEHDVAVAARPWLEHVRTLLADGDREVDTARRLHDVASRLPASYRDRTAPSRAIDDVLQLDALLEHPEAERTAWLDEDPDGSALLIAQRERPLTLSDVMPVLESLGLRVDAEYPHALTGPGPAVHLHEFRVSDPDGQPIPQGVDHLTDVILESLAGRFEIDSLNRLVLTAGLTWREVAVVRAYRRYRRQVGTSYSAEYTNAALAGHAEAVRAILEVFRLRFDPDITRDDAAIDAAHKQAHRTCDAIERLDHDRIVRGILDLVDATLRTTAYIHTPDGDRGWTHDADGRRVPVLAFKFDPSRVPEAPAPLPHREVFVASPAVEGIHLRGGEVARGGLRHSDRHDDLRTEILGLMKAQVLKNALIVPTGAKGGFVCKRLPTDRDAARDDVERQYVAFISALLDLTDDVDGDQVVPPARVVRWDDDDPYLVVAADKGTATFSDVANDVAEGRGFWLADAFASGGSSGYDHKGLGITARGAWTVIARHFAELGLDLQSDPITVAGVGDMSGDVFGNGMLLSRSLRLVAAFDHRDIFLDPDPDPDVSFVERERLYGVPGSTWQDYDRDALSPGAMIVPRSAKSVEPTPAVRELLGLSEGPVSPDVVMRAILRCQVDLMWFGGIGTYIKAATETHGDVGDRINDEVRVNATDVRARVVGEGANLAVTARGRIQYARRGGRIDQDAVHNAAGVDISDHEVNLPAGPGRVRGAARPPPPQPGPVRGDPRRRRARAARRRPPGGPALAAGRQQPGTTRRPARTGRCPRGPRCRQPRRRRPARPRGVRRACRGGSRAHPAGTGHVDGRGQARRGRIGPDLHTARRPRGRPGGRHLPAAPPAGRPVPRHRLHRELVATIVANDLVDRLGPVWPFHLAEETGSDLDQVIAATLAAWGVVDATRWWAAMDTVDAILPPERSQPLATSLARLVMGVARRLLDDTLMPDVAAIVDRDAPAFEAMRRALHHLGTPAQAARRRGTADRLIDDLVDPSLADLLAGVAHLGLVVDVAATSRDLDDEDPADVADAMLRVAAALGLDRLDAMVDRAPVGPGWERRERKGLAADVQRLHAAALRQEARHAGGLDTAVAASISPRRLHRVRELLHEVESLAHPPLTAVSVVVRAYADLLDHRG